MKIKNLQINSKRMYFIFTLIRLNNYVSIIVISEYLIVYFKMNRLTPITLRKSSSLYETKQVSCSLNPEQLTQTNRDQSHMEQLILQKYNFSSRLKTKNSQELTRKYSIDKANTIPCAHMILISQLPSIKTVKIINNENSIFQNQKIKNKSKQNPFQTSDYSFVVSQKRKLSDYKNCIKKVQMNTTYRGFNFRKDKINNKNRHPQNQDTSITKDQETSKTLFDAAERKRIIHYIIQRGFARKMEESLLKVRNQKKTIHNQTPFIRKAKAISPYKPKRSVVFTTSPPASQIESNMESIPNSFGKRQNGIEPW